MLAPVRVGRAPSPAGPLRQNCQQDYRHTGLAGEGARPTRTVALLVIRQAPRFLKNLQKHLTVELAGISVLI